MGDFNGDGVADLAVANYLGQVHVLLGNGDGSFQDPVSYSSGGSLSFSVAVGDFNGDGTPDLAVTNYNSNTVGVLLGNGDGTFQAAHTYGYLPGAFAVAVGDFNNDGFPDLAVADDNVGGVSVLLNAGDGSFHVAQSYLTGPYASSVAVGDFNGDGNLDLVVGSDGRDKVSVLLGNGDGSFQPKHDYPAGPGPQSVAVGDFNGDGFPDLAGSNYGSHTVNVLLNAADWADGSRASDAPAPGSVRQGERLVSPAGDYLAALETTARPPKADTADMSTASHDPLAALFRPAPTDLQDERMAPPAGTDASRPTVLPAPRNGPEGELGAWTVPALGPVDLNPFQE